MAFPVYRNLGHVVFSVSTDFPSNSKGDAPFQLMTVLIWICMGLCDHARDVSLTDICKPSAFATEYCWKWFLVGIDVCIPHLKYEVKLNLSPWFSATCATAIAHRNHLLFVPTEYSSSKVKFRQDSNCSKGMLKVPSACYVSKTVSFPETCLVRLRA